MDPALNKISRGSCVGVQKLGGTFPIPREFHFFSFSYVFSKCNSSLKNVSAGALIINAICALFHQELRMVYFVEQDSIQAWVSLSSTFIYKYH